MTFQTPSQDWLSRRPVREPASRGGPPDDEGWGPSQPQGGLSVLGEAQWWEPERWPEWAWAKGKGPDQVSSTTVLLALPIPRPNQGSGQELQGKGRSGVGGERPGSPGNETGVAYLLWAPQR